MQPTKRHRSRECPKWVLHSGGCGSGGYVRMRQVIDIDNRESADSRPRQKSYEGIFELIVSVFR